MTDLEPGMKLRVRYLDPMSSCLEDLHRLFDAVLYAALGFFTWFDSGVLWWEIRQARKQVGNRA